MVYKYCKFIVYIRSFRVAIMRKWEKLSAQKFFTSEPYLIRTKCKLLDMMGFAFTRSASKVIKTYFFDGKVFTGTKDGEFLLFDFETCTLEAKSRIKVPEFVTFCLIITPALNLVACNPTTLYSLNLRTQKIDFSFVTKLTSISCLEVFPSQQHFLCISQTSLLIFHFPTFTQSAEIQLGSSLNTIYSRKQLKLSNNAKESNLNAYINLLSHANLDLPKSFIVKFKLSNDLLVLITLNNEGKIIVNEFGQHNNAVCFSLSGIRASGFCLAEKNEKALILSGIDKKISIFLLDKGKVVNFDENFGEITDINLNSTEKFLLISCSDYSISILKAKNLKVIAKLPGITEKIEYLAYIPDKNLIISQVPGRIIAYYANTKVFNVIKSCQNLSCCITKDFKQLIIGSTSIETLEIDSTFILSKTIELKKDDNINLIKLEPSSQLLISINSVNDIVFWQYEKSRERYKISLGNTKILSISIFAKAKYLLAVQESATCFVLRLRNVVNELPFEYHSSSIVCAQFQKNNEFLLTGSHDSKIAQWDLSSHQLFQVFEASSGVSALILNNKDDCFAAGHLDGLISMWSLHSNKKTAQNFFHTSEITGLKYINTDFLISVSKDNTVKIIKLNDFSIINTLQHSHPIFALDISINQKYFAVCFDNSVQVYMTQTPTKSLKFSGHRKIVYCVCIYNKAQQILSGSFDNKIKVWSIVNRNCEATLNHHSACVWSLKISTNEKAFISCSWDNKAIIWDLSTFEPLHTLNFPNSALWGLEFSENSLQAIFFLNNTLELRDIQTILKSKNLKLL